MDRKAESQVLPSSLLVCFKAVREALGTHSGLSEKEIDFGVNTLCSLYREKIVTLDQLALFLLLSSKTTYTGNFALSFNHDLDNALHQENYDLLRLLATGPKEIFVELYDNPRLNQIERYSIVRIMSREYNALRSALMQGLQNSSPLSLSYVGTGGVDSLYTECYRNICLRESEERTGRFSAIEAEFLLAEGVPQKVHAIDHPPKTLSPRSYCFTFHEIMNILANQNQQVTVNPRTGEPFAPWALKMITDKFSKEAAMVQRYDEQLHPEKAGLSGRSRPNSQRSTGKRSPYLRNRKLGRV